MRFNVSDRSKTALLAAAFMALGYEACGGTTGMGAIQAADGVNTDNILQLCPPQPRSNGSSEIYGDYVAGRMMKTSITYNEAEGWVEVRDSKPTPDYQGWCKGQATDPGVAASAAMMRMFGGGSGGKEPTKYDSYQSLLKAAAQQIGVEITDAAGVAV